MDVRKKLEQKEKEIEKTKGYLNKLVDERFDLIQQYAKEKPDMFRKDKIKKLVSILWKTDHFAKLVNPWSTQRLYVANMMKFYTDRDVIADLKAVDAVRNKEELEELAEMIDDNLDEAIKEEEDRKAGVDNL